MAPTPDGGSQVWLVGPDGVVGPPAPALAGRSVRAFRISPDGRRVAFVVDSVVDGVAGRHLGVAQIRFDADDRASLDGWRDVPVVVDGAGLGSIADVAWVGPSTLDVVGTAGGSQVNAVFSVGLDGVVTPEEIGRPSDAAVAQLAWSSAGLIVLDVNQKAFRWVDAHSWDPLGTGWTAVAYPT